MIYCIYQISRTPVAPENYIAFCSIPESFFATNAEYLVEETNRTDAIRQFFEAKKHIVVPVEDGESFTFIAHAKQTYFRRRHSEFVMKAAELADVSIDAFVGITPYPIGTAMYELNRAYCDKFADYVMCDGELTPFDQWLRDESLKGTYYIGGVLEYHY